MQCSPVLDPVLCPQKATRPRLTSYDSGQECSLEHWLGLIKLVEREAQDHDLDGYVFDDACFSVSNGATRQGLF
jgi:hypothetical protein